MNSKTSSSALKTVTGRAPAFKLKLDKINRKLVKFWQTDLTIFGNEYTQQAIDEAWYATLFTLMTGTGLLVCIAKALL